MRDAIRRIGLTLRTHSPGWVRTVYRTARSIEHFPDSKPLPAELIRECRFCASRTDLLYELPRNAVAAELGVLRGDFAKLILSRTDPRELNLIDLDIAQISSDVQADQRVRCHRGFSHEVIAGFPDNYFDWIYIDADHSYAGTLKDARASASKLKPGGFMVFNDFAHIDLKLGRYGVHRAVSDFMRQEKWPMCLFAFDTNALYDVALRKPSRSS